MSDIQAGLARCGPDLGQVWELEHQAALPGERERWHALWLRAQGWSANTATAIDPRRARGRPPPPTRPSRPT